MDMYNKIFTKILDSSIWLEPTPTRIVWITLIAAMDENGFCAFAAVGNVADRARVTEAEARAALDVLEKPDPESSEQDNEGRRIERVPGGWIVLNAPKYRALVTRVNIQEKTKERVRRFREKKRSGNAPVTGCNEIETPSPVRVLVSSPLPPVNGGRMNRRSRKASVGAPVPKELRLDLAAKQEAEELEQYRIWQGTSSKYKAANPWTGKIPGAELAKAAN